MSEVERQIEKERVNGMKVNWLVRFKNKVWLTSFLAFAVSTVYTMLGMFDVAPAITQDSVIQVINAVLQLLGLLGIIVDPTTPGMADSQRAMNYVLPGVEKPPEG